MATWDDYDRHEKIMTSLARIEERVEGLQGAVTSMENRLIKADDSIVVRVNNHSSRLQSLEKMRWYASGAIAVVAFFSTGAASWIKTHL